jgi:hypothetical protein
MATNRQVTEECYNDYEARKGPARNDVFYNAGVLFQVLVAEASSSIGNRKLYHDVANQHL